MQALAILAWRINHLAGEPQGSSFHRIQEGHLRPWVLDWSGASKFSIMDSVLPHWSLMQNLTVNFGSSLNESDSIVVPMSPNVNDFCWPQTFQRWTTQSCQSRYTYRGRLYTGLQKVRPQWALWLAIKKKIIRPIIQSIVIFKVAQWLQTWCARSALLLRKTCKHTSYNSLKQREKHDITPSTYACAIAHRVPLNDSKARAWESIKEIKHRLPIGRDAD